ncbi:hypothetical protein B0I35DRAFT_405519 [Stachybotrys elegans]|uniref:histidine kinase n=1 Tax=Stachybotrys elegans TaxID=80388 RepID=A0A8K0T0J7_9HYPO|nr:hypothetical protein B0I35DRAFT_405519 [Stachybotrys elegans]
MKVAIREQLAALVIFLVLLSLCIVSVPTWLYVNQFVRNVEADGLALTASLKASRITAEVNLIQTSCITISSRLLIQRALEQFYDNGTTNWDLARDDIQSALSTSTRTTSGLLQARLFSRNQTGASPDGLLSVTSASVPDISLPYYHPNGSVVKLGDSGDGYPPELYPNITYVPLGRPNRWRPWVPAVAADAFDGIRIHEDGGLLLGPLVLNETTALLSVTFPIRDNQDGFILGYMTILARASSLVDIRDSREGMGSTGVVLIAGPTNRWNRFNDTSSSNSSTPVRIPYEDLSVRYVLPPSMPPGVADRHVHHSDNNGSSGNTFPLRSYPAALDAFSTPYPTVNNAHAILSTRNEENFRVAVGFARTNTPLLNWIVLVEKQRSESYEPIITLRNILLGTVFGTAGLITLLIIPCAHLSVLPIRRLMAATEKTVSPPGYEDSMMDFDMEENLPGSGNSSSKSKKGLVTSFVRMIRKRPKKPPSERDATRRMFKIPGKVDDTKHYITDELTELTKTFNDMSDELVKQYMSLDEKVAERTKELEQSKKAAEAANESKTLFIANISHELKTPLNGILGMCAVCMEETDILRIKQSLKTLYKSGDLLLHLLEDLLSFSKNQIGQQLSLEMKEFRLGDIRSQILTIFDKQVREGKINFSVKFIGSTDGLDFSPERVSSEPVLPALGPPGTGRLKDMCLWGDQHRILQVIINLVSNSLKFTPAEGMVEVRIRCIGEEESVPEEDESRTSSLSRTSRTGRPRHRGGSGSTNSGHSAGRGSRNSYKGGGTALAINPMDPKATPHVQVRERSPTPPPAGAKTLIFEIEVQDTGPGIPEHMQQKVFEPFVQGDLGLSKKFGGTGLGLSICHQLASLMGGSISLRSTIGVGTTFTMQIPLKYVKERASSTASSSVKSRPASVDAGYSTEGEKQRSPAAASKSPSESKAGNVINPRLVGLSQPFFAADPTPAAKSTEQKIAEINRAMAKKGGDGKLRVLVADDNSTNIEVVSRMLKLEDIYDVSIAKDGQEAYDLVKEAMEKNESFDVIFMDVQMPNLDGLQSTRLIREMGYRYPIVALTAFSEESNVKECIDSGMDEFLAKPIRRPALKQVLKKFATIPEEPETASVSTKNPRENGAPQERTAKLPNGNGHINGNGHANGNGKVNGRTPEALNGVAAEK